MKIMASSPIISWQIDTEPVTDFIFLGFKITAVGDCSHEIKRHLLLGRKVIDQPRQHIKKQRNHFADKGHLVKAMVFPVVMYRCESWTIKKAECQRIHGFQLWCWRRLLGVPWTAWRWNPSILKNISPEYSLQRLMLKLKLQYFGHLMWRTDSLVKTLILGKIEPRRWTTGNKMVGWQHWLEGHEFEQAPGVCDGQGGWACCLPWGCKVSDITKQLNRLTLSLYTYGLKWELLSRVRLFVTPWTVVCEASLSMGSPGKNTGVGCHFLLHLTQG